MPKLQGTCEFENKVAFGLNRFWPVGFRNGRDVSFFLNVGLSIMVYCSIVAKWYCNVVNSFLLFQALSLGAWRGCVSSAAHSRYWLLNFDHISNIPMACVSRESNFLSALVFFFCDKTEDVFSFGSVPPLGGICKCASNSCSMPY